ncbi:MAG: 30S ribosomal protein S9 [Candidatus Curtissbacteria bacterium]|nr:30S ribosomal protein S9 [Candidatus Curtissbacteria bacterium]
MEEQKTTTGKTSQNYVSAHGRRKEASARVRLFKGKGDNLINSKPMSTFFPSVVSQIRLNKVFELTRTSGKYYATVTVKGSGKNSQLEAVIHGLARALATVEGLRSIVKKAGMLTRDARVKERRKYGLAQKARKGKQSPKR